MIETRGLMLWAALLCGACGDTGQSGQDVRLDFGPPTSGGSGGRAGSGGSGGAGFGGSGGSILAPPAVSQMTPTAGDYGTIVTITGSALGGAQRPGSELLIGADTLYVIAPDSPEVQHWTEQSIEFRFPFPHEGTVVVQTPNGLAIAGEFEPSWDPGPSVEVGAGSAVLSTLELENGEVAVAFSGLPIRVVQFGREGVSEATVPTDGIAADSFRLYRATEGGLRGFALSSADPPVIVDFASGAPSWTAVSTTVTASSDHRVAGGTSGGVVWFSTVDGWQRARTQDGTWTIDKGPIVAPAHPDLVAHAADAAGAFYVVYNHDSGNFLDDLETPYIEQLAVDATTFSSGSPAGSATDDYLTELALFDRSAGVLVSYCGSDVDPWGFSETGYACFFTGYASDGTLLTLPYGFGKPAFAVASSAVAAGFCDGDSVRVVVDDSTDAGSIVAWPCSPVEGAVFDGSGSPLLVVRSGAEVYVPRPRPTP